MPKHNPVGVIHQPYSSGSEGKDGVEFICYVGGREPQIPKLWTFSKDVITREVHPFARIDVSDYSGEFLQTDYSTEVGRREALYGQRSINGSVEWLGIPAPFCDTGVAWTDNLLVPKARCRD